MYGNLFNFYNNSDALAIVQIAKNLVPLTNH